jgi:hypothetical protein
MNPKSNNGYVDKEEETKDKEDQECLKKGDKTRQSSMAEGMYSIACSFHTKNIH